MQKISSKMDQLERILEKQQQNFMKLMEQFSRHLNLDPEKSEDYVLRTLYLYH